MKILVLNPPRVNGFPVVRDERFEHKDYDSIYPSLSLLWTASLLINEGFETKFLSANAFDLSKDDVIKEVKDFYPDIVITRCAFDTQKEDIAVLKEIKNVNPEMKTILRCKIISEVPEIKNEIIKNGAVDYFSDQPFIDTTVHICKSLENGEKPKNIKGVSFLHNKKVVTNKPIEMMDVDELPLPAYDLLPKIPYRIAGLSPVSTNVVSSFGCPFKCTFCATRSLPVRFRSPEKVLEELNFLKELGIKKFSFFDDTFGLDKKRTLKVLELMEKEKLDFDWNFCTRAEVLSEEVVIKAKRLGCVSIGFGLESGSEKILRTVNKGFTKNDIKDAVNVCKKHKMKTSIFLVFGLPGETEETIKETISFVKTLNPFYTQISIAVPFPNTEMYKYYEENGLLLTKDWSKYCPIDEPVIRTKELSAERLKELRGIAYKELVYNPVHLIRQISLTNMGWNVDGIKRVFYRTKRLFKKRMLR